MAASAPTFRVGPRVGLLRHLTEGAHDGSRWLKTGPGGEGCLTDKTSSDPPQRRRFHRRLATQAKRSGHGCSARATWRSTRHTARSRRPPTRQSALTSRSRSPLIRWPRPSSRVQHWPIWPSEVGECVLSSLWPICVHVCTGDVRSV